MFKEDALMALHLKKKLQHRPTWATITIWNPKIAVILCDSCLRVEERKSLTALVAQTRVIVGRAVEHFFIILLSQVDTTHRHCQADSIKTVWWKLYKSL